MKNFVLGIRGFPNIQGGVEKHCEELYPRLAKLGCELTVITRTPYVLKGKRLPEWKGIKFIHLWSPRQKSIETIIHTFLGSIVCMLKRPNIVHIHNIGSALVIPFLKLFRIKTVFTYHSVNYQHQKWGKFAKFVLKIGEFLGIRFANKIIVVSEATKDFLEKKYNRKDLEFISNGVTLPEIVYAGDALKKYNLEPERYIFAVCRFVPEKGLHDLIAAYRKIESPAFKLVIAGDADYQTEYSKNIKKSVERDERIILTGFIFGKPLQELYSNARLFVLPSYYEGSSIALLEALSYGLPVLVSDIPAHRGGHFSEFRYFPAGDLNVLADKMVELFKHGITAEKKVRQREFLKENYNWDKIAKRTFEVYKKVTI